MRIAIVTGFGIYIWIVAVIALALGANALARRSTLRREAAEAIRLRLDAPPAWKGDVDRLVLFACAYRAKARLRPFIRLKLVLKKGSSADLVIERNGRGEIRFLARDDIHLTATRPELLPAADVIGPARPVGGAGMAAALAGCIVLYRQATTGWQPPLALARSLMGRLVGSAAEARPVHRYLAARFKAIDASEKPDARAIRSACETLLGLEGAQELDQAMVAANCAALALEACEISDSGGHSRVLALLDKEIARLEGDGQDGKLAITRMMKGRLLAEEARQAEDASLGEAASVTFAQVRAGCPAATPFAFSAGLGEVECHLMEAERPKTPDIAARRALDLIATLESSAFPPPAELKTRLALASSRALFLQGKARGDRNLIEQSLAVLDVDLPPSTTPRLRSMIAEARGGTRLEIAMRRTDAQQMRLAIADFEAAASHAPPARRRHIALGLARAHAWLYETLGTERHFSAASIAYRRATSSSGPGRLGT
ncbi:MAG: hypothetical protein F9K44_13280, partial [Hyphomicrobiaceae bacterium]